MAITNALHRTWAEALYDVAEAQKKVAEFEEQLTGIEQLMAENPEFRIFVTTPDVKQEDKLALIQKVFEGKIEPMVLNFLLVAVMKGRLGELDGIHQAYIDILDSGKGRQRVKVTSAVDLPEAQVKSLTQVLEKKLGKTVVLEPEVDSTIIGGLVIQYGDTRVDGSIRRQIAAFRKDIKERVKAPTS